MYARQHAIEHPDKPAIIIATSGETVSFKCPRTIDFVTELPRLPTGKLYKRLLRDACWAGHQTSIV